MNTKTLSSPECFDNLTYFEKKTLMYALDRFSPKTEEEYARFLLQYREEARAERDVAMEKMRIDPDDTGNKFEMNCCIGNLNLVIDALIGEPFVILSVPDGTDLGQKDETAMTAEEVKNYMDSTIMMNGVSDLLQETDLDWSYMQIDGKRVFLVLFSADEMHEFGLRMEKEGEYGCFWNIPENVIAPRMFSVMKEI